MSDLRFGRSETNIRMVRTFASVYMYINRGNEEHSLSSVTTELGVASVVTQKRNAIYFKKFYLHSQKKQTSF